MDHLTLKQARLVREKSQEACANAIGVHVQTYRKIEENPEIATIKEAKQLSQYLDFPYDVIFFN